MQQPNVIICIYETQSRDFYADMGPFFADRKFAQEMGGWQFYNKTGSIWFVAYADGDVCGFCSAIREKNYWFYDNFFVLPDFRGQKIASRLHDARNLFIMSMQEEIRLIVNHPAQIHKFEENGFIHTGYRGRYRIYKWYPNKDASNNTGLLLGSESLEPKQGKQT